MKKEEFKKLANDMRRATPKNWVFLSETVEGVKVEYKAYGTWVQVMQIHLAGGSVKDGDVGDRTVKQYGEFVDSMLTLIN